MTAAGTLERTLLAAASGSPVGDTLRDGLRLIRLHLGMSVAFVSEFREGERHFRYVDADDDAPPIREGDATLLSGTYCQAIVEGRLPQLIRNGEHLPALEAIGVTEKMDVRAAITVPIRLSDGTLYGTLCCASSAPDESLRERDVGLMQVFAGFAAQQLERDIASRRESDEKAARIQQILDDERFRIVFQPIVEIASGRIVGYEALTRFAAEPRRSPDIWFAEAAESGLGEELELATIAAALAQLPAIAEDAYLSINVSPSTINSGAIERALRTAPLERILLEVTEHDPIADYDAFRAALAPLRERGLKLAVDDAGAGYASFRHILSVAPDVIKLDTSLTRDVDRDPSRRALAAALIAFARDTGSRVVAEGVETAAELDTLRELGATNAQGYFLG
nr:EAL domain-containing protein [Acidobacteriota bacterium]